MTRPGQAVRTVLVHLDGAAAAAERLRVACSIARRFDAKLFAMSYLMPVKPGPDGCGLIVRIAIQRTHSE